MPVITAHPTEARRRSTLDHLARIEALLDELERAARARSDAALDAEVLALHATEDARARRPTPLDEVENALDVFRRSLLDVTPRVYRTIEDRAARAARRHVAAARRSCAGAPGSAAIATAIRTSPPRSPAPRSRASATLVLARYLADVAALGRSLSVSALRARRGSLDELTRVARARSRAAARGRRARAAAHGRTSRGARSCGTCRRGCARTLEHARRRLRRRRRATATTSRCSIAALRAAGFAAVADQELRDALRRVDVFGFHLASLDLRQHSGVHDRVVAELLARGGRARLPRARRGRPPRAARRGARARRSRRCATATALSPEAQEVLATLEVVGRARRELGPRACERYVVSFTRDVSDLLEVVFLARAAGLAPGELRPVPLLEQLEDLERAGAIATRLLARPGAAHRARRRARGDDRLLRLRQAGRLRRVVGRAAPRAARARRRRRRAPASRSRCSTAAAARSAAAAARRATRSARSPPRRCAAACASPSRARPSPRATRSPRSPSATSS